MYLRRCLELGSLPCCFTFVIVSGKQIMRSSSSYLQETLNLQPTKYFFFLKTTFSMTIF